MLTLISLLLVSPEVSAEDDSYPVVILNDQVPYDRLSRSTLRSIFTMRLNRWADGSPIKVFVLADSDPVHRLFSKRALAVFPYQLRQTWDRSVFSGTGQAPIEMESQKQMLETVQQTVGAIGYILGGEKQMGVRYVVVE